MLPFVVALACGTACTTVVDGDPKSEPDGNPIGSGLRVSDVADPAKNQAGQTVHVTGVVVTAVDGHSEATQGNSRGTVYVQDLDTSKPFSGISLYAPAFDPSNLRVTIGDVLDLTGRYVELGRIGGADFAGSVLPQLERPVARFRYETLPEPVELTDISELDDYETGRKWMNRLVVVKNVRLRKNLVECTPGSGRVVAPISDFAEAEGDCPRGNRGVTMTNELFDLKAGSMAAGTELRSLTGIVTWFFNYHIAPRSERDIRAR